MLTHGIYHATPPTPADGEAFTTQLDSAGNLKVYVASLLAGEDVSFTQDGIRGVLRVQARPIASAGYSPTPFVSFGTLTAAAAKATPGNLTGVRVTNANAAVRYFQVFNLSTGVPSGTPIMSLVLPAGSATVPSVSLVGPELFSPNGLYLSVGVTWGISTTAATYVAATAADHQVNGAVY